MENTIQLTIKATTPIDAKLIETLLFDIVNKVPYETQIKLARLNAKNPKGINSILSNPLVKRAIS